MHPNARRWETCRLVRMSVRKIAVYRVAGDWRKKRNERMAILTDDKL